MPKDNKAASTEDMVIDTQKLRSELDRIHAKKKSSGESSSALSQQRKAASEGMGIQRDALSLIERIDGMGDDKLSDFLRSFRPMYEALIHDWEGRIQDLVDKAQQGADEMDGEMGD